jgi:hypothetical protein
LILLAPVVARADGAPAGNPIAPGPSGWKFQFTPYAWTPWVTGDAVVRGRSFSVDETPVDVLEHLDFAWMSYMQARRGAYTFFTDIIYADIGNSDSLVRSHRFSPHVSGTLGAALSADYSYWTVEGGVMGELARYKLGHGPAETDSSLELLGGLRYWHQELDVDVSLAGTLNIDGLIISGDRALAKSGGVEWVDPFIGARFLYSPSPGEEIMVRGDIGGFGWASKFTWQAIATYNWFLCDFGSLTLDGYAGWRALYVDYTEGSGIERYEFDVLQQGPVVGFTGRF